MKYTVYMHEHRENNKRYIGITCQNPRKRWGNGKNYKPSSYFRNAIDKYGWDMFRHEILYTNLTKEEACKLEQELIQKYKTNDRRYGYNNSIGGEIGTLGNKHKLSDETKEKMSKAKKGKKHWWKGKGYNRTNHKCRPIICLETNIEYSSLGEASRLTGISKSCISLNANRKNRQSYAGILEDGTKLHWQYKDTQ